MLTPENFTFSEGRNPLMARPPDRELGVKRVFMLATIQISREGRQSLRRLLQLQILRIVQRDQFINDGFLRAAGRNSSGAVVINKSDQGDALATLDTLLRLPRNQVPQTLELKGALREFHKVRDEIASSLTKWLTKEKQLLAAVALSNEVVEAAHTAYKLFGL